MKFIDRTEAGELLAAKLYTYTTQDVVVYAIPRGGVETASAIAKLLHAPLEIIVTRKIGHPENPEYAIAAVSESGFIIGDKHELAIINMTWLKKQINKEIKEATRRRKKYENGREFESPRGKIAIVVDDGIATGWTFQAALRELEKCNPRKVVIATPIMPRSVFQQLKMKSDEVVALEIPSNDTFLGAIGMYYDDFHQLTDEEVIALLDEHTQWLKKNPKQSAYQLRDRR